MIFLKREIASVQQTIREERRSFKEQLIKNVKIPKFDEISTIKNDIPEAQKIDEITSPPHLK
jgi:hypothetical protein